MDSLKGQNLMKSDGSSVPADSALWRLCLYPLTDHQKTCNPTWRSLMVTGLLWNTILLLPMIWSRNMVRKICQAIHDKQIIFCSGISGIPSLMVVKLDGTVVTKDGRSHVTGKVPAQAVKDWKVFWQRDEGWWGMRGNKEWAKNGVQRVTKVNDHAAHKESIIPNQGSHQILFSSDPC